MSGHNRGWWWDCVHRFGVRICSGHRGGGGWRSVQVGTTNITHVACRAVLIVLATKALLPSIGGAMRRLAQPSSPMLNANPSGHCVGGAAISRARFGLHPAVPDATAP
jgi:hypothetical protein